MKDFNSKKYLIRQILHLTDKVYIQGGTSELSDIYLSLISKQKELLEYAGLEYSKENVRLVFDYPFNPSFEVKNVCNLSLCTRKESLVRKQYVQDIRERSVIVRDYTPWDIDLRVLNILTSLQGLTLGDDIFFE